MLWKFQVQAIVKVNILNKNKKKKILSIIRKNKVDITQYSMIKNIFFNEDMNIEEFNTDLEFTVASSIKFYWQNQDHKQ